MLYDAAVAPPRYIALVRADALYSLPDGTTAAWVATGYVHRTWFVDHGRIVEGIRTREFAYAVAQARARAVANRRIRAAQTRGAPVPCSS